MDTTLARATSWHWRAYAAEALLLGLFMVSASVGAVVLEHPMSPVHRAVPDPAVRRALMGLLMGVTAVLLIRSPAGRHSGAHMNPGVTLAYLSLGRVRPLDAAAYVASQVVGGVAGMVVASAVLGPALAAPGVDFVVTRPGPQGPYLAAVVEVIIAFALLSAVLRVSSGPLRFQPLTPVVAGSILAVEIFLAGPVSGTSLNPARTLASAVVAGQYTSLWVYLVMPPLGMLLAARLHRPRRPGCAKLDHRASDACIHCGQPGR